MFRSTSLRLAALYTAAFALCVLLMGAGTLMATRAALRQEFESRINAEALGLQQEFQIEGLAGVLDDVKERNHTPGALHYGLEGPHGEALAGRLAGYGTPLGWSDLRKARRRGGYETLRVLTTPLPQGYRLLVGDDDERAEALEATVLRGSALAFFGVVVLGIGGGFGLSHGMSRRLAAMSGTAEAIIDGDLGRRIPVSGGDDDLGRLAATFNRMLDRIGVLMESLRHVSNDVAHDLRTPLTRLRQKLEACQTLADPEAREAAVTSALADVDAILTTFAALLRISQIEASTRRDAIRPTDLAGLAQTVVEAFAPSAEEAGHVLRLEAAGPVMIEADAELLTQMLVNLVENGLRHGGPATDIRVAVTWRGRQPLLSVADSGPGVPEAERERIFDRFYRLEASRSTPGDGLGLALVAAVARRHHAVITLPAAERGLTVEILFPPRPDAPPEAAPR